jgi:hypothetical protein
MWFQVVPSGSKWFQVVPTGSRNDKFKYMVKCALAYMVSKKVGWRFEEVFLNEILEKSEGDVEQFLKKVLEFYNKYEGSGQVIEDWKKTVYSDMMKIKQEAEKKTGIFEIDLNRRNDELKKREDVILQNEALFKAVLARMKEVNL